MGTQFWWFYDVLTVSMTLGIGYAVIAKGFNKVVFQLAGFSIAVLAGVLGANLLAPKVYDELFSEKIGQTVQSVLTDEEFDIFERVSESLALAAEEGEEPPDAEALLQMYLDAKKDKATLEDWYLPAFSDALLMRLDDVLPMHPQDGKPDIIWLLAPNGSTDLLEVFVQEDADVTTGAGVIEKVCYRQNYTQLARLALFLLIELVVLIICCIIATMMRDLEETMHLRRGDHALAVPVALVEAAVMLMVVCVTVRLIVQLTDNQMLLFNRETIDETFLFRHIYRLQDVLFGHK